MSDDVVGKTVAQLGALLCHRKLSPVELLQACLSRVEALDDRVHAFTSLFPDSALERARKAEAEIAAGDWRGPLHGIPIPVKDGFEVAGSPSAWSSNLFAPPAPADVARYTPAEDATVVARLRDAGAVVFGKTAIRQAGEWSEDAKAGESLLPRNPWNLDHSVGGSSSGSAAGVAAGFFPATVGEDTGGSTRLPAAYCGITGLRPTQGRISRRGSFEMSWQMDMPGPMAWTAEDCALVLRAVAGRDPRDPLSAHAPVPDYGRAIEEKPNGLRACLLTDLTDAPYVSSEVNRAVHESVRVLEKLGVVVESRSIPILELSVPVFRILIDTATAGGNQARLRTQPEAYSRTARVRALTGSVLPSALVTKAERARLVIRQAVLDLLREYDVLLSPTAPGPAPPAVQASKPIESKAQAAIQLSAGRQTLSAFSLAGVPALSVPCGFSGSGLPLGLQIVGRPFDEGTLLRVGHAFQQATEWHSRRPELSPSISKAVAV